MVKTGAFIFHRGQNVRSIETIETIMIVRYSIEIVINVSFLLLIYMYLYHSVNIAIN